MTTVSSLRSVTLPPLKTDLQRRNNPSLPRPPLLEPGCQFGQYTVKRTLGQGGYTDVYLAIGEGGYRALKVVSDPAFSALLEKEAKQLNRLAGSPHIVQLIEAGSVNGFQYISMEYINGITIDLLFKDRPMPLHKALELLTKICYGLAHTHDQGLVHKDIKPRNILLQKDNTVKLIDYNASEEYPTKKLSENGTIAGTLSYMSPEQLSGEPLDPRSDIFSLGILFYNMLTGQPLKRGKGFGEVYMTRNLPLPSLPDELDAPLWVREMHLKMTKIDPNSRYRNCREIIADLEKNRG